MSVEKNRAIDLKVGLFVCLGGALLVFCIFLIGRERNLFDVPAYIKTEFKNVAGLKVGAAVRLSGVDIGIISAISFPAADVTRAEKLMPYENISNLDFSKTGNETRFTTITPRSLDRFQKPQRILLVAKCDSPKDGDCGADVKHRWEAQVVGANQFGDEIKDVFALQWSGRGGSAVGEKRFSSVSEISLFVGESASGGLDKAAFGFGGPPMIGVEMRIKKDALERVRDGSVAVLSSDGLLGDKTIDISLGPSSGRMHEDGHNIPSEASGLDELMAVVPDIKSAVADVSSLIRDFHTNGGGDVIIQAVSTLESMMQEIKNGEGLIHQLIWDEGTAKRFVAIVGDVQTAVTDVEAMIHQVRTKDSLVHSLMYDKKGKATIESAAATLAELQQILDDVQTKNGIAHQLIYDEDNGDVIANVKEASADVKEMTSSAKESVTDIQALVADAKNGKGTVGALLTDPTVYEDLKTLLGNVKRNEALKALVRYGISQEDTKVEPSARQQD